jgi:hypothetical protein
VLVCFPEYHQTKVLLGENHSASGTFVRRESSSELGYKLSYKNAMRNHVAQPKNHINNQPSFRVKFAVPELQLSRFVIMILRSR